MAAGFKPLRDNCVGTGHLGFDRILNRSDLVQDPASGSPRAGNHIGTNIPKETERMDLLFEAYGKLVLE
jgi:hypothetical protein